MTQIKNGKNPEKKPEKKKETKKEKALRLQYLFDGFKTEEEWLESIRQGAKKRLGLLDKG